MDTKTGFITNEIADLLKSGKNGSLEYVTGTGEENSFIISKNGEEYRVTVTEEEQQGPAGPRKKKDAPMRFWIDDCTFADLECREGRWVLRAFGRDYGEVCVTVDSISSEDALELIQFKDSPHDAFGKCGAEEVYRRELPEHEGTVSAAYYYGQDEILQALKKDPEIQDFLQYRYPLILCPDCDNRECRCERCRHQTTDGLCIKQGRPYMEIGECTDYTGEIVSCSTYYRKPYADWGKSL